MFKIQKFIYIFLLLVGLLIFNNSFVLAYEIVGPAWSFKTGVERMLTTSTTPTSPALPTEPPVPVIKQGSGQPFAQVGPAWSFKTGVERTLITPIIPTTPVLPTEPPVPAIKQGSGQPFAQVGPAWSFKTGVERMLTTSTTPTLPTLPTEPPIPPIGQGGLFLTEAQISPIWNFETRIKPQVTDFVIVEQIGNEEMAGVSVAKLAWKYSDVGNLEQTKYDLLINDVDNINDPTPEVNFQINSEISSGNFNTKTVLIRDIQATNQILYDTTYYWWVKVYNSGGSSDWVEGLSFKTIKHAFPFPDFSVSPEKPIIKKEVKFMQDNIKTGAFCFNNGAHLCQNDSNVKYEWDFNYNSGIDSTLKGNATTSYSTVGIYKAMLKITDDIGSGTKIKDVVVASSSPTLVPPVWREVSPSHSNSGIK